MTSFRFNLLDGTNYELIYVCDGIKSGDLISKTKGLNVRIFIVLETKLYRGGVTVGFYDMILGDKGLLVELRCKNSFNEQIYAGIVNYLNENLPEWKSSGFIPVADAVAIFNLIDELSGGSRFWSEEVQLRVEDASLEVQDIISALEE